MSAGLEGLTVSGWVYTRITTDAAVQAALGGSLAAAQARVWEGVAPDGTAEPYVTFTVQDPLDVKVVGLVQVMATVRFQVRVTAEGASYDAVKDAYAAVHAALEAQTNQQTPDGLVLTCGRVSGYQFPERVNGIEYRHLGGLYETQAQ